LVKNPFVGGIVKNSVVVWNGGMYSIGAIVWICPTLTALVLVISNNTASEVYLIVDFILY